MTANDLERLIDYLNANANKYALDTYEEEENGHTRIKPLCVGDFSQLYELMAKFVAEEADRTCGPNYEDMYERLLETCDGYKEDIRDLNKRIFDLECLNREYECRDAYKNGAIEMNELITGRRMGYNECGGMTIGPR